MLIRILIAFNIVASCWNLLLWAPWWGASATNLAIPIPVQMWPLTVMVVYLIFEMLPALSSFRVAWIVAVGFTTLMTLFPVYLHYEFWHESLSLVLSDEDRFHPHWLKEALFYYSGLGAALLLFRIDRAMGKSLMTD